MKFQLLIKTKTLKKTLIFKLLDFAFITFIDVKMTPIVGILKKKFCMYNLEPGSVEQNTSVCLSNNNMVRNKKKKFLRNSDLLPLKPYNGPYRFYCNKLDGRFNLYKKGYCFRSTFAVDGKDMKVNVDVERVLKDFHGKSKPIG